MKSTYSPSTTSPNAKPLAMNGFSGGAQQQSRLDPLIQLLPDGSQELEVAVGTEAIPIGFELTRLPDLVTEVTLHPEQVTVEVTVQADHAMTKAVGGEFRVDLFGLQVDATTCWPALEAVSP